MKIDRIVWKSMFGNLSNFHGIAFSLKNGSTFCKFGCFFGVFRPGGDTVPDAAATTPPSTVRQIISA